MAVHILLTEEAEKEAKEQMMSSQNIVNISNGQVLATPAKDMLIGFFLMTNLKKVERPKMFSSCLLYTSSQFVKFIILTIQDLIL